jgi:hypothetical protein
MSAIKSSGSSIPTESRTSVDPTQTFGQHEQLTGLEEAPGAVERAFKLNRDHAAERTPLRAGERVLRSSRKPC